MMRVFCEDHWDELTPRIEKNELNGIALKPLGLEAIGHHKDVEEEYDGDNFEELIEQVTPVCCFLDGRTTYSDETDFEDDYEIFITTGEVPIDMIPDAFWAGPEVDI